MAAVVAAVVSVVAAAVVVAEVLVLLAAAAAISRRQAAEVEVASTIGGPIRRTWIRRGTAAIGAMEAVNAAATDTRARRAAATCRK